MPVTISVTSVANDGTFGLALRRGRRVNVSNTLAMLMHPNQKTKGDYDGVPASTDFPTDSADPRR